MPERWCRLPPQHRAGLRLDSVLTAREVEVLSLLAAGHSDAEISHRLSISQRTVAYHVATVRDKLGATTRAHAVVRAIRDGWLHPE